MDTKTTSDSVVSDKKMECRMKESVVKSSETPTQEPITTQPNNDGISELMNATNEVQSTKSKEKESSPTVKNNFKAKIAPVELNTQPDESVSEEDEDKPNDKPETFMTKLWNIFTPKCMTITAIVAGVAVCITGTTLLAIYVPKVLAGGGGVVAVGGAGAGGAAGCSGGGSSSKCDCDDCCRGCDCRGCGDCCVICLTPSYPRNNGCGPSYYSPGCCRGSDDCCDCCCICCSCDNERNPDEDDQDEEGQVDKKKKGQVVKKQEVYVTQPVGHPSAQSEALRY